MDFKVLKEKINQSKSIVITSHRSPDGDAVGSSLALALYLKKIGKNVTCILPDAAPKFLAWMQDYDDILIFENEQEKCTDYTLNADLLFVLDYNDISRVGDYSKVLEKATGFIAMIDHHLDPKDFADWMYSDTSSCSTAQLIYKTIAELGDAAIVDPSISEGIYVGLITDSGSFRFPSVQSDTHDVASALLKTGLKHGDIHEKIYDVNSIERLKMLGYALCHKLKVLPNIPVAVIYLTKEEMDTYGNKKGSTEGIVNFALSIEGIKMAAFLKEDVGKVKMSFRSKGDVAVNEFSGKNFSGGGHKNAAGGVSFEPYEETIKKFEKVIYEFWES